MPSNDINKERAMYIYAEVTLFSDVAESELKERIEAALRGFNTLKLDIGNVEE